MVGVVVLDPVAEAGNTSVTLWCEPLCRASGLRSEADHFVVQAPFAGAVLEEGSNVIVGTSPMPLPAASKDEKEG